MGKVYKLFFSLKVMINESRRVTIIHADDEESLRHAISRIIRMKFSDCNLEQFGNGAELEKRLNQSVNVPGVVLTDNNMPGITGEDVIRDYAQRPNFAGRVPFVLVSGLGDMIGERVIANGAYALLNKPFLLNDFKEVVGGAIDYARKNYSEGD